MSSFCRKRPCMRKALLYLSIYLCLMIDFVSISYYSDQSLMRYEMSTFAECIQPRHADQPTLSRWHTVWNHMHFHHLLHQRHQQLLPITQHSHRGSRRRLLQHWWHRNFGHSRDGGVRKRVSRGVLILHGWCQSCVWVPDNEHLPSWMVPIVGHLPRAWSGRPELGRTWHYLAILVSSLDFEINSLIMWVPWIKVAIYSSCSNTHADNRRFGWSYIPTLLIRSIVHPDTSH